MEKKTPRATVIFAGINIIVFLILEILGDTENADFMLKYGAMSAKWMEVNGGYWRIFTAMFLHFGFGHILNNMVMLVAAGNILEDAVGTIKFSVLYILSGVGGNILSYLQQAKSSEYIVSAGASGAIFGIIGAFVWIVIRNKGRYKTLNTRGLVILILLTFYYGFVEGGIDNWGHLGGLISGFILGMIFYRKEVKKIDFGEQNQYTI